MISNLSLLTNHKIVLLYLALDICHLANPSFHMRGLRDNVWYLGDNVSFVRHSDEPGNRKENHSVVKLDALFSQAHHGQQSGIPVSEQRACCRIYGERAYGMHDIRVKLNRFPSQMPH